MQSPTPPRPSLPIQGPIVVKIGGSTLGGKDTTLDDLVTLQKEGRKIIVVHGGGQEISRWMNQRSIKPRFVRGLRVTDAASLDIVAAVLAGLINKQLVTSLIRLGAKVIGLSGVDSGLLECSLVDPKLGYVGKITKVNTALVEGVISDGYIPLIAPIGFDTKGGPENPSGLLNINGDTATGELARAMNASKLIFLTNVAGVQDEHGNLVPNLPTTLARRYIRSGIIRDGMIPKVEACLQSIPYVPIGAIIDGRVPEALIRCVNGEDMGTQVRKPL